MEFVEIPPGRFLMGAARYKPAPGRFLPEHARVEPDAQPLHIVYITRPFFLGVTEVTGWEVSEVHIAAGKYPRDPRYSKRERAKESAFCIASWNEANQLAKLMSRLDPDYDYRLPTEAEWEYACRGQVDCIDFHRKDVEVVQPRGKYGVFDAVRRAPPNGFGLYDMLRNAGEFCSDWYSRDYYSRSPLANPTGPPTGGAKVARGVRDEGGGWYAAWRRYPVDPGGDSNILLGVRLVLEPKGRVRP
ncbi:MAG: formylglycine-generating enzyme family protein [Planctomycetes bacterium]|nr:formylglycine-generating enzyme family protein [Planctomycetota bacterium]